MARLGEASLILVIISFRPVFKNLLILYIILLTGTWQWHPLTSGGRYRAVKTVLVLVSGTGHLNLGCMTFMVGFPRARQFRLLIICICIA